MFYQDIYYKSEKLDNLFFLTLILGMYQYITIPIFPDRKLYVYYQRHKLLQ